MTTALSTHLAAALAESDDASLVVAYSGGPDSTALLHALATLAQRPHLRALHIDHGLNADSGRWAAQCRAFADTLDVPVTVVRVSVDLTRGEGLEAAARRARHAAFASAVRAGERLVAAHHRDDQVETVLLKLLRGAGPEGLGGMRELRPLGAGWLWRPLLGLPRDVLLDHVALHGLPTVHDPSNDDTTVARAWLRQSVLPSLRQHWPQAAQSIVHSARLCREADEALRSAWLDAYEALGGDHGSLDASGWLALRPGWRGPLTDHWLHAQGLSAPTTAQRESLERQVREAAPERLPVVGWRDTEVRLWRGRLYATRRAPSVEPMWSADWTGEPMALPGGGVLRLEGPRLARPVRVRYRQGGERLRPRGDRHTRELRDLFQAGAVPPWVRPVTPIVCDADGTLLWVGDRWITDAGHARLEGRMPLWQRAPLPSAD